MIMLGLKPFLGLPYCLAQAPYPGQHVLTITGSGFFFGVRLTGYISPPIGGSVFDIHGVDKGCRTYGKGSGNQNWGSQTSGPSLVEQRLLSLEASLTEKESKREKDNEKKDLIEKVVQGVHKKLGLKSGAASVTSRLAKVLTKPDSNASNTSGDGDDGASSNAIRGLGFFISWFWES